MRKPTIAAVIASTAIAACSASRAEGGGATVSRNYSVPGFDQIEVAGPYDVDVRTGGKVSVSASGDEQLLERTIVEVKGDRLVIHPRQERWWRQIGWSNHGKARFAVTVPRLRGASIAGSGDIRVDRVQGSDFAGSIAGSGDLNVAALDVQQLKLSIAGSGGMKAGSGRAHSAKYDIAGSGDLDAGAIATQDVRVSIAGSGSVRANASQTANVDIMGSGDVDLSGGAKCKVSKAGSGSVRCS